MSIRAGSVLSVCRRVVRASLPGPPHASSTLLPSFPLLGQACARSTCAGPSTPRRDFSSSSTLSLKDDSQPPATPYEKPSFGLKPIRPLPTSPPFDASSSSSSSSFFHASSSPPPSPTYPTLPPRSLPRPPHKPPLILLPPEIHASRVASNKSRRSLAREEKLARMSPLERERYIEKQNEAYRVSKLSKEEREDEARERWERVGEEGREGYERRLRMGRERRERAWEKMRGRRKGVRGGNGEGGGEWWHQGEAEEGKGDGGGDGAGKSR